MPISLVAVLALAAFISAGLWLVPSGNQNAEAQGFADDVPSVCLPQDNNTATTPPGTEDAPHDTPVADQCVADGNSVTLRFTTPGVTTQVFTNGKIVDGEDLNFILDDGTSGNDITTAPSSTISYKEVEVTDAGPYQSQSES